LDLLYRSRSHLVAAAHEPDLLHWTIAGRHVRAVLRRQIPGPVVFDPEAPPTVPGVGSDIKAEGVEELVYPQVPVPPVKEFMAIMRVTDDLLPSITTPVLILQSTEDHVVPPENGPHILERLGGEDKELVWLENSYHVATLDNDADLIAERTAQFIRGHAR
jgi:carboxylesterase